MRRVFILDIKSILVMESELLGLMEKYVYFQLYNVYIFIFFNRFKSSWVKNVNEVQLWSGILEIYLGLFYIAVSTKRFAIIRCELGGRWLGSNYNVFALWWYGDGKQVALHPITVLQPYLKLPILRFTVTRPYIIYLTWFKCEKIYQKC